jgi:hypothetical protein
MFGLFKGDPFEDAALGRLERKKGYWRGRISLPSAGSVELAVSGGRSAPDPDCLAAARDIAPVYERLRPQIAAELAEHRSNGLDESDPKAGRPLDASQIWDKVRIRGALVEPRASTSGGRLPTIVVEYQTEWDEEHTLAAVIEGGKLIELSGSVLSVF